MSLTLNEKRNPNKPIGAGKLLSDAFRLFADKREVELVWNGKSRELGLISVLHEFTRNARKMTDIFGNDTMRIWGWHYD